MQAARRGCGRKVGAMEDEIVLICRDVCKSYRRRLALQDLSLTVRAGEVLGVLGPNGAGKTTAFRLIAGLTTADSGTITVGGDVTASSVTSPPVAFVPDTPAFYPWLSAERNVQVLTAGPFGVDVEAARKALVSVGMANRSRDKVATFSRGMSQRLAVAVALATKPQVILLDEPGNGLDPAALVELRRLIAQIAEQGTAVLVASHQLAEVQHIANSAIILRQGRVVRTVDATADLETEYLEAIGAPQG